MTVVKRPVRLSKTYLPDLQPFVDAAIDACIEIDHVLSDRSDLALFKTHGRGAGGDLSMGYDLAAEAVAVKHLGSFGTICSEESGVIGAQGCRIILDPLDGSDNYASNFPYYGVSIALKEDKQTVVGLVCDLGSKRCFLKTDERHIVFPLYARSLQQPVAKNPTAKIGLFEKARNHPEAAITLSDMGLKFRAPGAIALSFARAHYVKYVLFFGTIRSYDVEAALYLCSDLHCHIGERVIIVAQDADIFETLLGVFKIAKDPL